LGRLVSSSKKPNLGCAIIVQRQTIALHDSPIAPFTQSRTQSACHLPSAFRSRYPLSCALLFHSFAHHLPEASFAPRQLDFSSAADTWLEFAPSDSTLAQTRNTPDFGSPSRVSPLCSARTICDSNLSTFVSPRPTRRCRISLPLVYHDLFCLSCTLGNGPNIIGDNCCSAAIWQSRPSPNRFPLLSIKLEVASLSASACFVHHFAFAVPPSIIILLDSYRSTTALVNHSYLSPQHPAKMIAGSLTPCDMGRGAYDTTGVPKPPPRPQPR
jgi:hypothetical protein